MFELLAKLFTRTLKKFQNTENENEKKSLFFKVIFYIVCALVSLILYIPPRISFVEALGSVVVFIFITTVYIEKRQFRIYLHAMYT